MEDSKSVDQHNEIPDKNIKKEVLEIKNKEPESIENIDNELNQNKNLKINLTANNIHKDNNKIFEEDKNKELTRNLNANSDKDNNKKEPINNELIKEKTTENIKSSVEETNSDSATSNSAENVDKLVNKEYKKVSLNVKTNANLDKDKNNIETSNNELIKEKITEDSKSSVEEPNSDKSTSNSAENVDKVDKKEDKKVSVNVKTNIDKNNTKEISPPIPVKAKIKPVKEPPIEKKPFLEFVNDYLIPEIKNEFKQKGKEVNKIILEKTHRPIAEDICWVIYCEINDTCNFWLSFERDDITSLKSFSLCKNYEKPSIIESFLIDEKKITLKLIISRILQRLNGQKLIGAN